MNAGKFYLAAALIICCASDAAPSGQITADPEVVFVPSGGQGTTLISWATTNCANAQVTVQSAGGTENLFGDATSFQNSPAPWIGLNSFTFRLYGDRTRTLLLDSVVVTGVPAPTGSISASPMTFTLATSDGTFSTTLSWTTSGGSGGWVTQAAGEGEEQLIGQGGSNPGLEVSGLGAGRTVFRLYGDEALTLLLDSIETVGTVSPLTVHSDGTLRLDNRPFTGVGVNYYSAFERVLDNSGDTSYDAGFEALARWGSLLHDSMQADTGRLKWRCFSPIAPDICNGLMAWWPRPSATVWG